MIWPIAGGIAQLKAAQVFSAFNPSNLAGSGATLSNSNRTLTTSSASGGWVGGAFVYPGATATGQKYFEIKFTTLSLAGTYAYCAAGIGTSSWSAATLQSNGLKAPGVNVSPYDLIGGSTAGISGPYYIQWIAGGQQGFNPATPASGDVIMVAVDFARGVWWGVNGSWMNLNAGGGFTPVFPTNPDTTWGVFNQGTMIAATIDASCSMTLNTGNAAWAYTPPPGFTAWG